jgi:hypothetical protein
MLGEISFPVLNPTPCAWKVGIFLRPPDPHEQGLSDIYNFVQCSFSTVEQLCEEQVGVCNGDAKLKRIYCDMSTRFVARQRLNKQTLVGN